METYTDYLATKPKMKDCPECDGRGWLIISCCGDDISNQFPESDLCPTCHEHQGNERDECQECDGLGDDEDERGAAEHMNI